MTRRNLANLLIVLALVAPLAWGVVNLGGNVYVAGSQICFEGSTDDANEGCIVFTDPTGNGNYTIPAIASDTFGFVNAAQTFLNKTLTAPILTTPNLRGAINYTGTAVDDDDCTGQQGQAWWDSVDLAFEWCNANSGAPAVLSAGGGNTDPIVLLNIVYKQGTGTAGSLSSTVGMGFYSTNVAMAGGTAWMRNGLDAVNGETWFNDVAPSPLWANADLASVHVRIIMSGVAGWTDSVSTFTPSVSCHGDGDATAAQTRESTMSFTSLAAISTAASGSQDVVTYITNGSAYDIDTPCDETDVMVWRFVVDTGGGTTPQTFWRIEALTIWADRV